MSFLSRKPTAQQEEQAGIALTALFADLANIDGFLKLAKKHGVTAHVVEIDPKYQVTNIGKTSAFAAFREQVMATRPDIVDVRPVTKQHLQTFGFSQHAAAALYFEQPTIANRAKVWFFDLMG